VGSRDYYPQFTREAIETREAKEVFLIGGDWIPMLEE
jgi:hypothetical protein